MDARRQRSHKIRQRQGLPRHPHHEPVRRRPRLLSGTCRAGSLRLDEWRARQNWRAPRCALLLPPSPRGQTPAIPQEMQLQETRPGPCQPSLRGVCYRQGEILLHRRHRDRYALRKKRWHTRHLLHRRQPVRALARKTLIYEEYDKI